MRRTLLWVIFIGIIAFLVLSYTSITLHKLYNYYRLSAVTEPQSMNVYLKPRLEDELEVKLSYHYLVGIASYQGDEVVDILPNTEVAEKELSKYISKPWHIWYDPLTPTFSVLQKHFPTKEVISALILWAIFAYFIGLWTYVKKRG